MPRPLRQGGQAARGRHGGEMVPPQEAGKDDVVLSWEGADVIAVRLPQLADSWTTSWPRWSARSASRSHELDRRRSGRSCASWRRAAPSPYGTGGGDGRPARSASPGSVYNLQPGEGALTRTTSANTNAVRSLPGGGFHPLGFQQSVAVFPRALAIRSPRPAPGAEAPGGWDRRLRIGEITRFHLGREHGRGRSSTACVLHRRGEQDPRPAPLPSTEPSSRAATPRWPG